MRVLGSLALLALAARLASAAAPAPQDLHAILAKADALLEEAKKAYEDGRARSAVEAFVDAGFTLEEARIKFLVLQEIGAPDLQKTAADRLRAVQQLYKLINDGKVAVLKARPPAPADPAAPAPETPPVPATSPAPAPAPAARPDADAIKRLSIPDAAALKEADKLLRDLFKDDFAKKGVAESKAFTRRLLEQASKNADDPAGLYALYRAAIDAAVQGCDTPSALYASDELCRLFDVDGIALRTGTLAAAGKTARTPEDWIALAEAQVRLTEECIAGDLYAVAEKSAAAALQYARKANHPGLIQSTTTRTKEVAEAKAKFQALQGHLQTLAKTPDHPGANLEMGQFLCYVKGSWDLGLRFLAKGSDAALKDLAEKEIAFPTAPQDLVALAEGWEGLAAKEKSPLRKGQMTAHARELYHAAHPGATGLLRAKIAKKLEGDAPATLGAPAKGPALDLLPLIDLKKDIVNGNWRMEGKALVGATGDRPRVLIPYYPPDEYDVTAVAERVTGESTFGFGLSRGTSQWTVLFDTGAAGYQTGLDALDGKAAWENETSVKGRLVPSGKAMTYDLRVRRTGVTVLLDGKSIIEWQGDYNRLTVNQRWNVPDKKALFLCANGAEMRYTKLVLVPITGQGKRAR